MYSIIQYRECIVIILTDVVFVTFSPSASVRRNYLSNKYLLDFDTPSHMENEDVIKNIDIQIYWIFSVNSKSSNIPVSAGPIAEPSTIAAAAVALIDPRCFVPKNSAQNAFGKVVLAPDVIPRNIKPNNAEYNVSPKANNINAIIIGSWKYGINFAVPNLSNKMPDKIIMQIAIPV